jgi:spore germination protein GerM
MALALVVTGAVTTLVACGVPLDSKPRAIPQTTVSPDTQSVPPTTSASPTAQAVSVYFLNDNHLEEVQYPVSGQPTLDAALAFVLAGPAKGSPAGLTTAVPPGTELRGVTISDGEASIDLSTEINDISGENQKQAFAQLVFTALSYRGVGAVRFHIAGKAVDAPTDHGNLARVTADDYDAPLNPR